MQLKCNLMELTTKSASIPLVVSGVLICVCVSIPRVLRLTGVGSHYRDSVYSEHFVWENNVFKSSLSFHCLTSVTGACPPFHMGAHGWVAGICQPWERSPSRSWLTIVDVSGTQPPSLMQLLILFCQI